jgi:hypothetical protein
VNDKRILLGMLTLLLCAATCGGSPSKVNEPDTGRDQTLDTADASGQPDAFDAAANVGGDAAPRPNRTVGCNAANVHSEEIAQWVRYAAGNCAHPGIQVPGISSSNPLARAAASRSFWIRLPRGYSPTTAYPVLYQAPGCGPPSLTAPFVSGSGGAEAIEVALDVPPTTSCFDPAADSVDDPYFAALHTYVEDNFCVDANRQFITGYSSGAFLANRLGCAFSDVLRGQGTVAGGAPPWPACSSHPIAAMWIHDADDPTNLVANSHLAEERVLELNQCDKSQGTEVYVPPSGAVVPPQTECVAWKGCPADSPVVFCTTHGQAHSAQPTFAAPTFSAFFEALPSLPRPVVARSAPVRTTSCPTGGQGGTAGGAGGASGGHGGAGGRGAAGAGGGGGSGPTCGKLYGPCSAAPCCAGFECDNRAKICYGTVGQKCASPRECGDSNDGQAFNTCSAGVCRRCSGWHEACQIDSDCCARLSSIDITFTQSCVDGQCVRSCNAGNCSRGFSMSGLVCTFSCGSGQKCCSHCTDSSGNPLYSCDELSP